MRIITYFQEAFTELVHKVSWPSWSDLQNSAVVVMIASFIIAMIVFGMDFVFENFMEVVYSMFY
ncbi:MAG: preprotein translocase subunit SecE [Bacteroidales bacterium]